jgi:hypothetical protein
MEDVHVFWCLFNISHERLRLLAPQSLFGIDACMPSSLKPVP